MFGNFKDLRGGDSGNELLGFVRVICDNLGKINDFQMFDVFEGVRVAFVNGKMSQITFFFGRASIAMARGNPRMILRSRTA